MTLDKFELATLEACKEEDLVDRSIRRRSSGASTVKTNDDSHHDIPFSAFTGGNWHRSNSGDAATTAFEQEHEETTKVKNIENIVMGEYQVAAWYYSPFPAEYSDVETLFVCEFCLSYMRLKKTLKKHKAECTCRQPPGRCIYKHEDLAVYELDGKDHLAYCQKLCLLAKLFLDHKTLYYDVTPFFFYVITKVDVHGSHIVGYFSKEKVSNEGYNLACILTFPQYQKAGYGKFIISLSYELTKKEGITGSPEKPLSDLGKLSYRSYWTYVLMNLLDGYKGEEDLTINDISTQTGIKMEDIISTLQHLEMIKVRTPKLNNNCNISDSLSLIGVERTTRRLRKTRCHCRVYEKRVSLFVLYRNSLCLTGLIQETVSLMQTGAFRMDTSRSSKRQRKLIVIMM